MVPRGVDIALRNKDGQARSWENANVNRAKINDTVGGFKELVIFFKQKKNCQVKQGGKKWSQER